MDNHIYNLAKALTKKSQAVWRYEKFIKDSDGCPECEELWRELKEEDEEHVEKMKKILTSHAKAGAIK